MIVCVLKEEREQLESLLKDGCVEVNTEVEEI